MISQQRLRNFFNVHSILTGSSIAVVVFVQFLQTEAVSKLRLLACLGLLSVATLGIYLLHTHWLLPKMQTYGFGAKGILASSFLFPLVFLPAFYAAPEFPISILLRPPTNIALQFILSPQAEPASLTEADVKVISNKEVLGLRDFELNGTRAKPGAALTLDPGSSIWLQQEFIAAQTVILNLVPPQGVGTLTVYWDRSVSVIQLPTEKIVLKKKFETPLFVIILDFCAQYFLFETILLMVLAAITQKFQPRPHTEWYPLIIFVIALVLTAISVYYQTRGMFNNTVFTLIRDQYQRHQAVLLGTSLDPWQYRILSEWVAEGFIRFFGLFFVKETAIEMGFLSTRVLQNMAIFLLAFALYKKISVSNWMALLGLSLLSLSMLSANYDSDLALNTYTDILAYILAALLIIDKKYMAIIPLTMFAALNRETSGLIPFLLAVAIFGGSQLPGLRKYLPAILALAAWGCVFIALRFALPNRPTFVAYGHTLGASMWTYNISRSITWENLFRTFSILPILAISYFFEWPTLLRRFFIIMVPLWVIIHFLASVVAETRLFLVPYVIIFIPALLLKFQSLTVQNLSQGKNVDSSQANA